MADSSVFVDGVASGAFAEAFAGMPPWATEAAAVRIENAIKSQTKALSKLAANTNGPAGNPVDPDDLNKVLSDTAANARKSLNEKKEQQKDEKKWFEFWKDQQNQMKPGAGLIWATLTAFASAVDETIRSNKQSYDELYASGLNLVAGFDGASSGFQSLQMLAETTGVRFTELGKTMQKFSGSINAFGVGKFARTLSESSKTLNSFGFSAKESADLLGTYLESQRGYTDSRNKSEAEVSNGLVKFGKRIDGLSLATGMARQSLMDNIQAISQSTEAMILNGLAGTDATDKTLAFVASFRDQNVGRAFLRMMTDAISPLNDTFQSFQKTGFGGFGNELMSFTKGLEGLEPEEQAKKMAEFAEQNSMQMDAMMRQANLLRQTGLKAEAEDVLSKISGIQQQARLYRSVSEEERKKLKASNEASKQLSDAFEKFKAQLQITFAPTANILNLLTSGLEMLNTAFGGIRDAAKWLEGVVGKFLGSMGFTESTGEKDEAGNDIKKPMEQINLINWAGLVLAVGATIAKVGLLGSAFDYVYGKIKGGSKSASSNDSAGGGGKKSRAGRSGGKSGGFGLDNKAPGFIYKIADAIAAFGSPKVLLGVLAFAGLATTLFIVGKALQQFMGLDWNSLAIAGTAIAGLAVAAGILGIPAVAAAVITGAVVLGVLGAALGVVGYAAAAAAPGLLSLSASLASFQQINGENLIKVATGIGALSVALVAFSAANAAGSIGSVFSSLAGGLSKLFGGDGGPIEQIQKLASAGDGLNKTVTSLQGLAGALAGISSGLGKITGIEKINSIVTSINDLNLLKAAAFAAISPMVTAAPTKSTVTGTESLDKPRGSAAPVASTAKIEGPTPGADINSTINAQRLLIEQLVKSTNELVSVNKDILKYTKLKQ